MMNVTISTLLAEKEFSETFSIGSEASVLEVVKEMNRLQIGSMLIIDGGKLVGIFTERDVLRRVVVPGLAPDATPVSEVMTKQVDTFPPELSVDEAMAHMTEKRHRHIPVVEGDRILGLVSIGDITRWLSNSFANEAHNLLNYFTGTYPE